MPDTENCGRIPRKIPKTWSAEVVVGDHPSLHLHFVFLTYELVVKLSVVLMWSGHLQAGEEVGWNRGVAQGACCVISVWADLPVPVVVFLY